MESTLSYNDSFDLASKRLATALALSILIHLLLVLGISVDDPRSALPIEITLLKPPPAPATQKLKQQIVSPSKAEEKKPPENTNLLSDRDSFTKKQQVRKGMPEAGPNANKMQRLEHQAPPIKKTAPKKQNQPRKQIKLKNDALAQSLAANPLRVNRDSEMRLAKALKDGDYKASKKASESEREAKLYEYEPFRRTRSSALLGGRAGVPDYLPNIQDGDITLLNAKADRFAVFVRRVALQVFGSLRRLNWAEVPYHQLRSLTDFVTVHAVMSKDGKFLRAEMTTSSGVSLFDKVLVEATKSGTWDQNPPPAALAADGNFHFVFKARTWARASGDGIREQRWLLLATGLL